MNWDSTLDDHKNRKRWRMESKRRLAAGSRTPYAGLNTGERVQCRRLNEVLNDVERRFAQQGLNIGRALDARVADPHDWIEDYELELEITLLLRPDDPECAAQGSAVLYVLDEMLPKPLEGDHENQDYGIGGVRNFNFCPAAGQEGESHCYLYHEVTEHRGLDWRDIPRIGGMTVRLNVTYQQYMHPL